MNSFKGINQVNRQKHLQANITGNLFYLQQEHNFNIKSKYIKFWNINAKRKFLEFYELTREKLFVL